MTFPPQDDARAKRHEDLRARISLARQLGWDEGIEAAAKRIDEADNTMMKQPKLAEYVRKLKGIKP